MSVASIAPVSPPLAGRFDSQTSGRSAARMSSKPPSLFTLRGANSAMSTSPAQSSLCLMSSQLRPSPPPHGPPRALQLIAVERELPVPLVQRGIHVLGFGRPRSLIPEHDNAGAVTFRD